MQALNGIPVSALCLAYVLAAFGATPMGTLSGTVTDDKGAPIAGALVLYRNVPALVPQPGGRRSLAPPGTASGIKTESDGKFVVGQLPAGLYHVCAYGVSAADLGSCEWGQGTAAANVESGQIAQLSLQVPSGALLTFTVNDPNRGIVDLADLPVVDGRRPLFGANFGIGIWVGSRYVRASLVSNTGTTRQYQVAIPKTATARLFLDTSLTVLDSAATAIPVRQQSITISPAGQSGISTTLTVP